MEKTVLITGASSGVGTALAKYLSEIGFSVITAARRVRKMKKTFANNKNISIHYLDLNDIEGISTFLDSIFDKNSYIPFLINNAGVLTEKDIEHIRYKDFRYSFNVNSISPFLILQKLIKPMKKNNFGRIINLTSGAPLNCITGFGIYSASKGALNALTVTAAREYSKYNIKINLMSPGPVRTEMTPDAPMHISVCYPTVDYLLNLDESGPTGKFFG